MLRYIALCTNILLLAVEAAEATTSPGYSYTSNPLTLTTIAHAADVPRNESSTVFDSYSNSTSVTVLPSDYSTTAMGEMDTGGGCSGRCDSLSADCYTCNTSDNCTYGDRVDFLCRVKPGIECTGSREVKREFKCIYCFLLEQNVDYTCEQTNTTCNVAATPPERVKMNCTVKGNVFCLGKRKFGKMTTCNWTSGYKWSTTLILSITLGGFGADRFYLGFWREGLGKLFSFGGLGVWTLIDIVLIATSYLGPADGSLYIY